MHNTSQCTRHHNAQDITLCNASMQKASQCTTHQSAQHITVHKTLGAYNGIRHYIVQCINAKGITEHKTSQCTRHYNGTRHYKGTRHYIVQPINAKGITMKKTSTDSRLRRNRSKIAIPWLIPVVNRNPRRREGVVHQAPSAIVKLKQMGIKFK